MHGAQNMESAEWGWFRGIILRKRAGMEGRGGLKRA